MINQFEITSIHDLSADEKAKLNADIESVFPTPKEALKAQFNVDEVQADRIILTVGNSMMGDDGAGPLLAQMCRDNPVEGWMVIEGGSVPEDSLHIIRKVQPKQVVVVDAADFGEEPGEIRFIESEMINDLFVVSTHSLPLNFLIDELKTFVPDVAFVGIQPAIVAFYAPLTTMVQEAVEKIHYALSDWQQLATFEHC
ncbi:MAG: hydrogenase maturation peptidase HycI [Vibrio sp.]